MKYLKYFLLGLLKMVVILALSPVLIPLMLIDIAMWIGGADPFNTPIRRGIDKFTNWAEILRGK